MSTPAQRPTPETDALSDSRIGMWAFNLPIDFARKLERERDEAREQLESILSVIPADAPCLHAETGETVADYILDLQKEVGRVHALYFNDKQQLEAMREAIKDIYFLTEGCADGAPDASAHDKLCNEVAAKLQPFIKP